MKFEKINKMQELLKEIKDLKTIVGFLTSEQTIDNVKYKGCVEVDMNLCYENNLPEWEKTKWELENKNIPFETVKINKRHSQRFVNVVEKIISDLEKHLKLIMKAEISNI